VEKKPVIGGPGPRHRPREILTSELGNILII